MSNADIKGSIPGLIKNELAKKQGEVQNIGSYESWQNVIDLFYKFVNN